MDFRFSPIEKVCDTIYVIFGLDLVCYISSTLLLTLPVKRRQEEEIVWRRNETDREGENKNKDNKRKHQLESLNKIGSAEQY